MKKEKVFEITGKIETKKTQQGFSKKVRAFNRKHAADKILALMGSKHGLKRREIAVTEIKEVKDGEKESSV